jgi:hypothetical protein
MVRPLVPVLVVLLLGLVISVYAFASLASAPPTVVSHQGTYLTWENTGRYGYTAGLGPNTLFNNSTSLGPGQGSLFISLVRNMTIRFNDWFNLSASEGIQASWRSGVLLSSAVWNYTLRSPTTVQYDRPSASSLEMEGTVVLNVTGIDTAVAGFVNQTRYAPPSYAVVLDQSLNVSVTSPVGTNETRFTPSLSLVFASGLIRPGNLTLNGSGAVDVPYTVAIPPSRLPYQLAGVATAVLAVACAVVGYRLLRPRARSQADADRELKRITEPYKEAIAETATPPRTTNFVALRSWDDLIHVADMLGRPILQYRHNQPDDTRHFFYVLDGDVQYIYLLPSTKRAQDDLESPSAYE